jgi:hypothetical protein
MFYLTLGSCLKNEEPYMLDFVKYHRSVGVEKFVFFDRNYEAMHNMFANDHDVEIIHFPDIEGNTHQEAWGQLIKYNQGKTKWLALIDADQALVPVKKDDVKDILKDYEEFANLQLNWKSFGSGHQETRLPGSVYERFLMTCKDDCFYNAHTQFICQPDRTLPIKTAEPHYPFLPEGEISVNTNKEQIDAQKKVDLNLNTPLSFNVPPLHDVMWVAHYTNKSKEEWMIKNAKGRADIFGVKMPIHQFDEYESQCNELCEDRVLELWNKK